MLRKILALLLLPAALHAQSNPYELDTTFGTGGIAAFPQVSAINPYGMEPEYMIEQSNGRLLLLSRSFLSSPADVPLLRLKPNGQPDSSTGTNGIALIHFNTIVDFSSLQQVSNGFLMGGMEFGAGSSTMQVIKLTHNLNFDQSFGNSGRVNFNLGDPYQLVRGHMVVQPDEKILTGSSSIRSTAAIMYLPVHARLLPSGAFDPSYGVGGFVAANYANAFSPPAGQALDCRMMAMTVQPDGKLLVAGRVNSMLNSVGTEGFMVRHNANGTLDSSFGNNGLLLTGAGISVARKILLDGQGNIYFVGDEIVNGQMFGSVRKYSPSGVLQTAYGTAGTLQIGHGLATNNYRSEALTMNQNGHLYIAGTLTPNAANPSFILASYNNQGQPDLGFAPGGAVIIPRDSADVTNSLVLQADSGLILSAYSQAALVKTPMVLRFKRRGASPAGVSPVALATKNTLQIYPNPSKGIFTCVLDNPPKATANLSVLNALGQTIFQQALSNGENKIQIALPSATPAGIYQVRVQNDKEILNASLVLTR